VVFNIGRLLVVMFFTLQMAKKMRINDGGITTINISLYIEKNDNYLDLLLGSSNCNNLGIATNVGGFQFLLLLVIWF
jgi:hypothetical protein